MLKIRPEIIEGPYLNDLLSQPKALLRTADCLGEASRADAVRRFLKSKPWKRVVLTGMGSSFHTLHPLNLALIGSGHTPIMLETSELIHYGMGLCDADTLVVAVSQSGGSAEILRFLDMNLESSLLAVTNAPASRLAIEGDCVLLTQAGPESTVSCKTYLCGMVVLQWLADLFNERSAAATLEHIQAAPAWVGQYLADWRDHTSRLADWLEGVRHLFLVGRGGSLAAAGTGALIVKESAKLHAEGMSSAAFRHGPLEMMQQGMCVVVFGGADATRELNQRLADELALRGGRCEVISPASTSPALRLPAADPWHLPVLEILPVQMMTLALAGLKGREAGRFELARKITDTE